MSGLLRVVLLVARYTIEGQPYDNAWSRAVETLLAAYQHEEAYLAELEFSIRPLDAYTCRGTGYVVDCLHSAYQAQRGLRGGGQMGGSVQQRHGRDGVCGGWYGELALRDSGYTREVA